MERPNVERILAPLKDFQRETVDHVFRRMYTDADPSHRFLVADEVGLGKTLVGRGVVARTLDHLWDSVERLDIIYICSSGDIARQNVNRLNISGRSDWALASRVTMLPSQLKDIQQRKVNFIAFTPGTTFKLGDASGMMWERVQLHCLLEREWNMRGWAGANVLQAYVRDHERFRDNIIWYRRERPLDAYLCRKFHEAIEVRNAKDRQEGKPSLGDRFEELCKVFGRARRHIPREERREQTRFIGDLRSLLAATCIRALEPDLVILDEFQRFKDLLATTDDEERDDIRLARELFDYSHGHEKTRILLLSATPYRMYTTVDEAGGEDHYQDFLRTLEFLQDDPRRTAATSQTLQAYRRLLCRLRDSDAELEAVKNQLESELRRVMVRTERLAASEDRNGMLREVPASELALDLGEVLAHHRLHRIARQVDHPDTTEYWKAAPYLLSFMDDYALKKRVEEALDLEEDAELVTAIADASELFLPDAIARGQDAPVPPHSRLRWLLDLCFRDEMWKLLWIPSTLPYYKPSGVFAAPGLEGVTKRLIFSAWQVVPKAIGALLSYEAERRMLGAFGDQGESVHDVRDRLTPLLRFNRSEGRLTGLPAIALIYPSVVLAEAGDPRVIAGAEGMPTLETVLATAEQRIAAELRALASPAPQEGAPDESWYWAAPVLLDATRDPLGSRAWLERGDAAVRWSGETKEQADEEQEAGPSAWADHVSRVRDLLSGNVRLGPQPADLAKALALVSVAGPGVCALRAIGRVGGGSDSYWNPAVRDAAGQIAWSIRNLFNLPEVIALVRSLARAEPYWQRALEYCASGNLQAVLDEYVHVLRDSLGLFESPVEESAKQIAENVRRALGLRTAQVVVDRLRVARASGRPRLEEHRMRARYAVRFGEQVEVDGKEANRKDVVRAAFNSPFWPFVLASTSVGQEGLDFHLYCHAVIHWNLPSNPVDLEQREGRVHRFKGHAVRKNVARRHGGTHTDANDPWEALFDRARIARDRDSSDIVPYWVFPIENGAAIERHVPALPLSRDEARFRELKRALTVYRMVFGQPRQEELLEFLLAQCSADQIEQRLVELRIDLTPRVKFSVD